MSSDSNKLKTGSVEKAAAQIKENKTAKQKQLDRIMKEMQSSTVGSK